jgi:hypothetical protein
LAIQLFITSKGCLELLGGIFIRRNNSRHFTILTLRPPENRVQILSSLIEVMLVLLVRVVQSLVVLSKSHVNVLVYFAFSFRQSQRI